MITEIVKCTIRTCMEKKTDFLDETKHMCDAPTKKPVGLHQLLTCFVHCLVMMVHSMNDHSKIWTVIRNKDSSPIKLTS